VNSPNGGDTVSQEDFDRGSRRMRLIRLQLQRQRLLMLLAAVVLLGIAVRATLAF